MKMLKSTSDATRAAMVIVKRFEQCCVARMINVRNACQLRSAWQSLIRL